MKTCVMKRSVTSTRVVRSTRRRSGSAASAYLGSPATDTSAVKQVRVKTNTQNNPQITQYIARFLSEVECNQINNCDSNADCRYDQLLFSYRCLCRDGYEGDGITCTPKGKKSYLLGPLTMFFKFIYMSDNGYFFSICS